MKVSYHIFLDLGSNIRVGIPTFTWLELGSWHQTESWHFCKLNSLVRILSFQYIQFYERLQLLHDDKKHQTWLKSFPCTIYSVQLFSKFICIYGSLQVLVSLSDNSYHSLEQKCCLPNHKRTTIIND
jgi:hypothetical protein